MTKVPDTRLRRPSPRWLWLRLHLWSPSPCDVSWRARAATVKFCFSQRFIPLFQPASNPEGQLTHLNLGAYHLRLALWAW